MTDHAKLLRSIARGTLTVGQAADVSYLTAKEVIALADRGVIESFHVPMSRHRRIAVASLRDFLRRGHLPTIALDIGLHVAAARREVAA